LSEAQTVSLRWFITRRILQSVPLILGVIILAFILIHLTPGDVTQIITGDTAVSPEYLSKLRAELGLDRPLYEQLVLYLAQAMRGNLGYSFISRQTVLSLILERLPITLLLVFVPLVFSSMIGIFLGVLASQKQYSFIDNTASLISVIGFSIPVFWLAQILLIVLSVQLRWFPVQGFMDVRANLQGLDLYLDIIHHAVLPSVALGAVQLALVTRITRASMIEILSQDYIVWARSKGLSEITITFRHALRNALLPVATVVGYNFGFLLTGAILVETVFAWPGLGRLLVDAIFFHDYPVITGQLIFISTMVANLVTDLVYGILDPRIRYR